MHVVGNRPPDLSLLIDPAGRCVTLMVAQAASVEQVYAPYVTAPNDATEGDVQGNISIGGVL